MDQRRRNGADCGAGRSIAGATGAGKESSLAGKSHLLNLAAWGGYFNLESSFDRAVTLQEPT